MELSWPVRGRFNREHPKLEWLVRTWTKYYQSGLPGTM